MPQKPAAYKVQGMHRDSSPTNFNPEKAFEIVNMRLVTDEEGSAFSLVNEKGTTYKCVLDHNELLKKIWTPIGQCATTDSLIVFATCTQVAGQSEDAIFRVKIDTEDNITSYILYRGNLGFQADKPIETLFNYETEDIQKVYWIDGINQLRCINIAEWDKDGNSSITHSNTSFDSVLPLSDNSISVSIDRLSGGSFKAGVIQYYATYFNKYKTESAIIWQSPLLYLANSERGAETDSSVDTAFKFTFTGLDNQNWEFIRVYSVYRGSIDTEPSANIVQELSIKGASNVEVFDYGTSNTAINASDLYFVGSKFVKAGTMTVKDHVLFLGNLSTRTPLTPPEGIDLSESLIVNDCKEVDFKISETEGTYYKYDNQLDNTAPISTYKNGETYRFGYQLQDEFGAWGDPIWIKDATIDFAPKMNYDNNQEKLQLAQPYLVLPDEVITIFKQSKAIAIRPLVVYPDVQERSILCQGVVCPTVYNLKDRVDNSPYAQASWFMRPNIPGNLYNVDTQPLPESGSYSDVYNINYEGIYSTYNFVDSTVKSISKIIDVGDSIIIDNTELQDEEFKKLRISLLADEVPSLANTTTNTGLTAFYSRGGNLGKYITSKGSWVEFRHNYALKTKGHLYGINYSDCPWGGNTNPGINKNENDADRVGYESSFAGLARGAEIDATRGIATLPVNRVSKHDNELQYQWTSSDYVPLSKYNTGTSAYYVDANVVTLNSPEIELVEDLYEIPTENYKFRIVGLVPLTANIGDMSLITKNSDFYDHDKPFNLRGFEKIDVHTENVGHTGFRGLVAQNVYNAWRRKINSAGESVSDGNSIAAHILYPWQITGNIQTFNSTENRRTDFSQLQRKILSNLRFSAISYYLSQDQIWKPSYEDTSRIITWTSTNNDIQRFSISPELNLSDIVYKGNVDSLAMQEVNGGPSRDLFYYAGSGEDYGSGEIPTPPNSYTPSFTTNSLQVEKGRSLAASIKYKSSPHFAIFLGGTKVQNQTAVEVLPTLGGEGKRLNSHRYVVTHYSEDALWKSQDEIDWNHDIYILSFIMTPRLLDEEDEAYYDFNIRGIILEDNTEAPIHIYFTLNSSTVHDIIEEIPQSIGIGNGGYAILDPEDIRIPKESGTFNYLEVLYGDTNCTFNLTGESKGISLGSIEINWQPEEYQQYLNRVGVLKDNIGDENIKWKRVYENEKVTSLPIQNSIELSENSSLNLPQNYHAITEGDSPINYGWLWLGEIYKDIPPTFGGTSKYALLNNKWEVAGESISLSSPSPTLKWSIGDTYYQRFDTLKTYAYSDTDENSVIDITSFMVETHLNIDGRYDRNRGQESNLNMSPKNFNLFNKVYTQRDNFFTYSKVDKDAGQRTSFPNQITWSLAKTAGEPLDQWMNITLTSILDLDGRKGNLSALKTFQNEVIAFQEKGIANVIYNPRTQITSTDGTPIYIANSSKVEGVRYFTEGVGCQDKWSIVTSPNGLYFIDFYNKSIYKFNGQLEDVASAQGFHTWCVQNLDKNSQVLGYYDQKNKDVYFINTDWQYPCLAFNEFTNSFSSFYSYKDARLSYIQDKGLWVTYDGKIYTHQTGDYNTFFNNSGEDYHVTVVCNQDGNLSKIFNTVEFRSDSWESDGTTAPNKTVDYLGIETDYQQYTKEDLEFDIYRPSNLKKKFNVWRANIPREQGTMNRFRDVWAKVTLGGKGNSRKTRLNDIVVYYT